MCISLNGEVAEKDVRVRGEGERREKGRGVYIERRGYKGKGQ